MFSDLLICLKACESEYHTCNKSEIIYDSRKISSGVNLALEAGTLSSSTKIKHKNPTISVNDRFLSILFNII